YQCIWVRARDAEKTLKEFMGVQPPGPANPNPNNPGMQMQMQGGQPGAPKADTVHISADDRTNSVLVSGPPNKLHQASRALAELDKAQPGEKPVPIGPPPQQVYRAPAGNRSEERRVGTA